MSQNQTRKIVKRTISSLYVLNCFRYFQIYILGQTSQKVRQENISSLYVSKCPNILKLYTVLKALLSKNWFYFFFLIF